MMEIDEEKEKQTILRLYRKLLKKAKPFLKNDDALQIKKAFRFAEEAHKQMRRKSGEPYIYHPISVAQICVEEIGLGTTSIIAALLHDVVEDTGYEISDIEAQFGPKVAKIVDGLTKISTKATKGKSIQAENFQRLLVTISEDVRVVLIKIADRLHNMRTLDSMPDHKRLKIRSETEYIYAPLAHRLGLYSIKSELEDLCLKYSDPEAYEDIKAKIEETKHLRNRFIRKFTEPIELALKRDGYQIEIKDRVKSIYSIYKKMRKQNITFDQVYDIFAIRIIVDTEQEKERSACWQIYSTVTDFYTPNATRLRDWISTPKSNGYESLHTTVMSKSGQWVEVQIRSRRMDEIAEKGYAAHWKYKHAGSQQQKTQQGLDQWLREVRHILENIKSSNEIDFINEFKTTLFEKEVFAFTPKGEMKIFPKGSTVLDFAFEIHSEIGVKCMAAKKDGKLVPFNYEIQNGDQIEILTTNAIKVNEGWLKVVKTTKAKTKIKEYLKKEHKEFSTQGKEIIKRKLKQLKLPYNTETVAKITDFFKLKSDSDLFYRVGKGLINHTEIKRFKDAKPVETVKPKPEVLPSLNGDSEKKYHDSQKALIVGDNNSLDYTLAPCCNPIPGDDIFGFITSGQGIKIHRQTCPNAVTLMANYSYRIMRAVWATDKHAADHEFDVAIRIEGTDRVGLMNDVTRVISNQMRVNIRGIVIGTQNQIFNGKLDLSVHSKKEFEELIRNIEQIEGIVSVTRMEERVES
jgi:GTP pyrophosphokinase